MKKLILFIIGTVCAIMSLSAQPQSKIKPLSIGDTVPDITINNIINCTKQKINLYGLKKELIIFDFFSTWCSSCIEALPTLDSLQKQFKNRIQIFVVDYEKANTVKSFLRHNPTGQKTSLPFITDDTLLSAYFPHKIVPHEVWIKPGDVLEATTAADQVNKKNITDLLDGKNVSFRIKTDAIDFSMQQSLFFNRNIYINKNDIKDYSILSGFIEGIPSGSFIKKDANGLIRRICFTNASIRQLYQFAFNVPWYSNRNILDVKDTVAIEFVNGDFVSWAVQHAYCYELLTSPITLEKARKRMEDDLANYFSYKAGVEKKEIKCLILQSNKNLGKSISLGGEPKHNFSNNRQPKFISNQSISTLIDYLNYALPVPVIDETNFAKSVDMKLPNDLLNIDSLRSSLHKYGFDLKRAEKVMDVFVISDK